MTPSHTQGYVLNVPQERALLELLDEWLSPHLDPEWVACETPLHEDVFKSMRDVFREREEQRKSK